MTDEPDSTEGRCQMSAMNMPGFTAETSIYATHRYYQTAGAGSFLSDGSAVVIPQGDCPWWKFFGCIAAVGGCTAGCSLTTVGFPACLGLCLGAAGAIGCVACAGLSSEDEDTATQAALSVSGGGSGGGGTGGGGPLGQCRCPRNNKCCGSCVKEPGKPIFCDGDCVPLTTQCP